VAYTLVNVDDPNVERFRNAFFRMRRALGTTAFGINEIRLPAGASGLEHDETQTGHEEVYVVVDGDGVFIVDGEQVAVRAGDYLRVDAAAVRRATAGESGLRFVAVGGKPRPGYDGRDTL
jgi:uncharacterized cupin superfamily protein